MFSVEFLHVIRRHELAFVEHHLPAGARILEIGGGTGFQARLLSERGFDMVSIDLPQSNYAEQRVYPVLDYDGSTIPFADGNFDVVFSSNVLEHVRDPGKLHQEVRRVLKPDGYCLHAMPSGAWSFWTIVTHYLSALQRAAGSIAAPVPPGQSGTANGFRTRQRLRRAAVRALVRALSILRAIAGMARSNRAAWCPSRHGEFGNVFTEIVTFGRGRWRKHFHAHGYRVLMIKPMGLFYTGYMLLGPSWPLRSRESAARWLGSACILYRVEPMAGSGRSSVKV